MTYLFPDGETSCRGAAVGPIEGSLEQNPPSLSEKVSTQQHFPKSRDR